MDYPLSSSNALHPYDSDIPKQVPDDIEEDLPHSATPLMQSTGNALILSGKIIFGFSFSASNHGFFNIKSIELISIQIYFQCKSYRMYLFVCFCCAFAPYLTVSVA